MNLPVIVDEIGTGVSRFKPGDQVFGTTTGLKVGANAEYLSVSRKWAKMRYWQTCQTKATYEEAAALPVGGMTALINSQKRKYQAR